MWGKIATSCPAPLLLFKKTSKRNANSSHNYSRIIDLEAPGLSKVSQNTSSSANSSASWGSRGGTPKARGHAVGGGNAGRSHEQGGCGDLWEGLGSLVDVVCCIGRDQGGQSGAVASKIEAGPVPHDVHIIGVVRL